MVSVLLSTSLYASISPYIQGSVLPGDELVSHSNVPLLLVLRHRRHGNCRLYLQVYRVCRVSEVQPQERLDSLAAFGFGWHMCVCVLYFKSVLFLSPHHQSFLVEGFIRKNFSYSPTVCFGLS